MDVKLVDDLKEEAIRYVRRNLACRLGTSDFDLSSDMAELVFRKLSLQEEIEDSTRDNLGRRQPHHSVSQTDCMLPTLDHLVKSIPFASTGLESPWPDHRPYAVCLTHDMDYAGHIYRFRGAYTALRRMKNGVGSRKMAAMNVLRCALGPSKERTDLDRMLSIEQSFDCKSTIFCWANCRGTEHVCDCDYSLNDPVRYKGSIVTVKQALEDLSKSGWQIGLHASITSSSSSESLISQKKRLEESLGLKIESLRFHYLSYNSLETPATISAADIQNDSTVGYSSDIGFRAGTTYPFTLWDWQSNKPTEVLEFPLHIMDVSLMKQSDNAEERCVKMLDTVRDTGGCLTILWHTDADDTRWKLYESVLKRAQDQGAWLCTMEEASKWWNERLNQFE